MIHNECCVCDNLFPQKEDEKECIFQKLLNEMQKIRKINNEIKKDNNEIKKENAELHRQLARPYKGKNKNTHII